MDNPVLNFDSERQVFEFNDSAIAGIDFRRLAIEVHPTEKYAVDSFEVIMREKGCSFFKKEVAHGCFEYICSRDIKG